MASRLGGQEVVLPHEEQAKDLLEVLYMARTLHRHVLTCVTVVNDARCAWALPAHSQSLCGVYMPLFAALLHWHALKPTNRFHWMWNQCRVGDVACYIVRSSAARRPGNSTTSFFVSHVHGCASACHPATSHQPPHTHVPVVLLCPHIGCFPSRRQQHCGCMRLTC
jgi:hypothetical protein